MAADIESLTIDWTGIAQAVVHELHMMFGSLQTAVVAIMLGIDLFYRVEWFELNTPLSAFLAPLFGGH